MRLLFYFVILNILLSIKVMAEKPYHHIHENGKFVKFRNYEGAPVRDKKFQMVIQKI